MINGISPAMSKDLNTAVNKFEIQKFTYASDKHSRKNLTGALQYKGNWQKEFSDFHIYLNDPAKDRSLLEPSAHLHYNQRYFVLFDWW